MNAIQPIFAFDVGDLIGIIVMLLVVILPVIGQLLARIRQAGQPGGAQAPRPRKAAQIDVADEIEVFMRRVLGGQEEPAEPVIEERLPPAAEVQRRRPVESPVQAVVIEAKEEPQVERLAEHVKNYFASEERPAAAERLGKNVAQAESQFDQHVHQVFDHQLGQLGAANAESPPSGDVPIEVPPTFAAGLVAMLSSAESLGQAIVLSEIIRRPEERWS